MIVHCVLKYTVTTYDVGNRCAELEFSNVLV